jgi:magnesium-transporting ATPase (P-type)
MYDATDLLRPEKAQALVAATGKSVPELLEEMDGICGVLPEDKYAVVKMLQERGHITAVRPETT